jgi:hypothetical protein
MYTFQGISEAPFVRYKTELMCVRLMTEEVKPGFTLAGTVPKG